MNPILKLLWKAFMGFHVWIYRASRGRFGGSMRDFKVLLLTTTGRKTGKRRTLPLGYVRDGERYVIMAANAGMNYHPAWYLNLQNNPVVELQVKERVFQARAETAQGDDRQRLYTQMVTEAPTFSYYQTQTTREIPMVVLTPVTT
ncbi:MAG: nitroreductase family deazaflavin-dependent oxidoreductase [Anaerolineae bacterium]|nr:nitroreductase family deazaflavin-dependent oxidoreductase [Anaerolineae bacterium]